MVAAEAATVLMVVVVVHMAIPQVRLCSLAAEAVLALPAATMAAQVVVYYSLEQTQ
jgi:hypothetical protein